MADTWHFELYDGRALYDGDYPHRVWLTIDGRAERMRCKAFVAWNIMLRKAWGPRAVSGLKVCDEFRRFMTFREWLVGHEQWERRRLVLRRGAREFDPDTTVLLPPPPQWTQPPATWTRTRFMELTHCGAVPLGPDLGATIQHPRYS